MVVVPARAAVPPWAAIPASGSPVPIVAIAPIPVISPAGVPELSWAPLWEGAGLSVRLGCGAHSGQAQSDGYGEYGCNKTWNSFHTVVVPDEASLKTVDASVSSWELPVKITVPRMTCEFRSNAPAHV